MIYKEFFLGSLLFFITFMFFYGPRLIIGDLHDLTLLILAALSLLTILIKRALPKILILPLLSGVLLFGYSYSILAIYNSLDKTMIFAAAKQCMYALAALFVINIYKGTYSYNYDLKLCRHIMYATLLNALFVIITMLIPSLQELAFSILNFERQEHWLITGHRTFDLSMGGGTTASIAFAFGFMATISLISFFPSIIFSLMLAFACALAVLFTGRTGQIALAMAVVLIFFFKSSFKWLPHSSLHSSRKIIFVSLVLLGTATSIALILLPQLENYMYRLTEGFLPWMTEAFESIVGSGESTTIDVISSSMYFLPDSYLHIIFGDSNAGRSPDHIYIASDVGYVRMIHSVGIIGTFIFYGFILYTLIAALRVKSRYSIIFIFISLSLLIFNFKEMLLFHKALGSWFFVFYLLTFASHRKYKAYVRDAIA